MNQDQTAKRWRDYLVTKLQDRYGLTQRQAQTKANTWLRWIKRPTSLGAAESGGRQRDSQR